MMAISDDYDPWSRLLLMMVIDIIDVIDVIDAAADDDGDDKW